MGPPQLHVVLIGLRRESHAVHEVEQAAVLLVPAPLDGHIKDLHGLRPQLRVVLVLGLLHQEPAALDVVARIDEAAGGDVGPELAVHAHGLQGALQLRLVVIAEDGLHALLGPGVIDLPVLRVAAAHH